MINRILSKEELEEKRKDPIKWELAEFYEERATVKPLTKEELTILNWLDIEGNVCIRSISTVIESLIKSGYINHKIHTNSLIHRDYVHKLSISPTILSCLHISTPVNRLIDHVYSITTKNILPVYQNDSHDERNMFNWMLSFIKISELPPLLTHDNGLCRQLASLLMKILSLDHLPTHCKDCYFWGEFKSFSYNSCLNQSMCASYLSTSKLYLSNASAPGINNPLPDVGLVTHEDFCCNNFLTGECTKRIIVTNSYKLSTYML